MSEVAAHHPLDGHHLVYQVFTRDTMLHSELVPAREPLDFPSFDVPPYTTHAEVSITLYGAGGEHIAMVRKTYHPRAIKAALNSISWRILEDYLSVVMKHTSTASVGA